MAVVDLLDRQTYPYAEVDRLVGLSHGTARRWINGYRRAGRDYEPILRERSADSEWATWGEFVEVRILAEFRDQNVSTLRLRQAVSALRRHFDLRHPLAYAKPYLAAEAGDLALSQGAIEADGDDAAMVVATGQLLLGRPGWAVIERANLALDGAGNSFASQLVLDPDFPDIVVNPNRRGGEPTFPGRRLTAARVASLVAAGEDEVSVAADFDLSVAEVRSAVEFGRRYGLAS